jgi:hypothetical protein
MPLSWAHSPADLHALLVDWPAIKWAAEVGHLYLAKFGPVRMAAVSGWGQFPSPVTACIA